MDTKLKKFKYGIITKLFAAILVIMIITAQLFSVVYFYDQYNGFGDYFESYEFEEYYTRLIHNVTELAVKQKNKEYIIETYDSLRDEYLTRFNTIENRLTTMKNFVYFIENVETGEVFTNMVRIDGVLDTSYEASIKGGTWPSDQPKPIAEIMSYHKPAHFNQSTIEYNYSFLVYDIQRLLASTPYEVYTAVLDPLQEGDVFYEGHALAEQFERHMGAAIPFMILGGILFLLLMVYLITAAGRTVKTEGIKLNFVDRIPIEIQLCLTIGMSLLTLTLAYDLDIQRYLVFQPFLILTLTVIGMMQFFSIVRLLKAKKLIELSLISRLFRFVKKLVILMMTKQTFRPWIVLILFAYGFANLIFGAILASVYDGLTRLFFFTIFAFFNTGIGILLFLALYALKQLLRAAEEIGNGNLDYQIDPRVKNGIFSGFSNSLTNIQGSIRVSVNKALKGEHMRTELITNVSHDLKTPLTSLISYADLLSKEEINNEKAVEYIDVINEKSNRLKQLVEDLIEASKASTGNMPVNAEKLCLNELLSQALGEYSERLEMAGLTVITKEEGDILVLADGRHTWRILENLFNNIIKYALPGSRVYAELQQDQRFGRLILKNISSHELNVPPEELMERFVRGDAARHAEGSGLGLSIAQALTNIQGGQFRIETDGDLFKAVIELPSYKL